MQLTDWLVISGGAAAILWVYWYFFLAERPSPPHAPAPEGDETR